MKLLSIDSGLNNIGFAVWDAKKRLIETKSLIFNKKETLLGKLGNIHTVTMSMIDYYEITDMVIELASTACKFNSKSSRHATMAMTCLYLPCFSHALKLHPDLSSKEVKKIIGVAQPMKKKGEPPLRKKTRKEWKQIIQKKLQEDHLIYLNGYDLTAINDHEVDAIAIGVAFFIKSKE